ncbi:MAG: response regulator [Oligoflexia bacterium]|nr:response regulator [Oligoflexia bacterium]
MRPRPAQSEIRLVGQEVWVVEDHAGANDALVEIARGLGATARGYRSGEEALACTGPLPAIVITDLRLPGMDGLDLVEALRSHDPAPETIVVTAHGSVEEAVRAMRLGAVDFLTKPLDLARVEAVLRGASALARLRASRAGRDPPLARRPGRRTGLQLRRLWRRGGRDPSGRRVHGDGLDPGRIWDGQRAPGPPASCRVRAGKGALRRRSRRGPRTRAAGERAVRARTRRVHRRQRTPGRCLRTGERRHPPARRDR